MRRAASWQGLDGHRRTHVPRAQGPSRAGPARGSQTEGRIGARSDDPHLGVSERPPSHYLGRFSVDSAVFDERALRLLVDTLGEDHMMFGSDVPYPLGESPAGDLIRHARFLSSTARAKLLAANAEAFLG
ncbi:amidohydrolase family protein [Nonomuraea sp. H19]|uniref:amidohydrolase family protein n=1 Tax=Nonomuraea sp. H19 TaxID=3452206 RepID=UPI003F8CC441